MAADRTIADHWERLVTVALLGTDRREPPGLDGPVGDLVADAVRPTAAERMLAEVAAVTAIRRAGLLPLPPVDPLAPPRHDQRPVCPAAAADRWRHVIASWPVLEDEWTSILIEHGWRAAPELVPEMLARHRRDPWRWARAVVAAGPVAEWLVELVPALDVVDRARITPETVFDLPSLPIPPELAARYGAPGAGAGIALRESLVDGSLGAAHRVVLVNLVARVDASSLPGIADELEAIEPAVTNRELAAALADLARTRHAMLDELPHVEPPGRDTDSR